MLNRDYETNLQLIELKGELNSKGNQIKEKYENERKSINEAIQKTKCEWEDAYLSRTRVYSSRLSIFSPLLIISIVVCFLTFCLIPCVADENWFGYVLLCINGISFITLIVSAIVKSKTKREIKRIRAYYDSEISENVAKLEKEFPRINENEKREIEKLTSEYEIKMEESKQNWRREYLETLEQKSLEFTESEVANEVADFLFEAMQKSINGLQINSYSEEFKLVLNFKVSQWNVEYTIQDEHDIFKFLSKRCKELTEIIDRKALAKALVLMVILKLNEKSIGSGENLTVKYDGASNYEESGYIAYIAQNEYFEDERKW